MISDGLAVAIIDMTFRTKLFLGMSSVLILVSFLTINLFYTRAHYVQRDNLRSRLVGIASTAALMIDAESLTRIVTSGDERSPEYQKVRVTLRRIKQSNPDIRYIYTMRKTSTPGEYAFIVDEAEDIDENGNGILEPQERHATIGEPYTVNTPELGLAFEGPIADREMTRDKWGVWLSGYAPIFDSTLKVVAILGIDMEAEKVRREEWKLESMALLTLALAVVISILTGALLSQHFTRPFRQVRDALASVGAGNLDAKLDFNRKDEIGRLGEAFNEMASSLARARTDLLEQQRTLEKRIAERTEELQRARAAAIESEKMAALGTIAGGIAHEFNNILCAVRGHVELAALNPTIERIQRAAHTAAACADRTRQITDALLSFARRSPLSVRPTDVRQLVETALGLFKTDFTTFNITVVRKFSDVELLGAEPERLLQAFANVISNARDAMRDQTGGRLTIIIRPVEQDIQIAFRDTGRGIQEGLLAHVFEPFYTLKAPIGGEFTPGSGLGLAAAHGIVMNHGGEITAENNEGGGSTIRIRLPVKPWPGKAAKPKPRRFPAVISRRVLVVEDEPDILSAMQDILVLRGWQVETAVNGEEALTKISTGDFPVYLVDIAMPGINGIELIRRLREMREDSIIVVDSGFSQEEIACQLADKDIAAYISKPFRTEELVKVLEELIEEAVATTSRLEPDVARSRASDPSGARG